MSKISNQYAAMPSLHCAWAMWCVLVMWPQLKSNWSRALLILYPIATVYCIVVTANHYFLDAVGGFITLGARIRRGEAVHGVDRPALGGEAP